MKGGVFALGNFDGVHRGHRAVIDAAVAKARALRTSACVLTFEPHPRAFFHPHEPPFRLTPFAAKQDLLKACGVDEVIPLPFTQEIAQVSARDFAEVILLKRFGAQHVVAGHDYIFGHKRGGDMQKLAAWLAPHHIGVTAVAAAGEEGEVFSSTRIRELLLQGEVRAAAQMLGRSWAIAGTVVKGATRGRKIGVPTANIDLGDYLRPKFGVYAVRAGRVGEAVAHRGVANIGLRPTVGGLRENLEAHLFAFDQDIYGQEWQFALTRFIRPERKFDSMEALRRQIERDIEEAKEGI
ncbi:MAG: bifunctional riboflavin kinase/FAD synthetase [Alphaproteobacteria bacterium]|nr:bifunctional riboflavin kinase/FAD synthetase [Alphaproteobacteria bacterium]